MKKFTSLALIASLVFSLLLTTSCNLLQPHEQSTTPEPSPTKTSSDETTTPESTTPETPTNEELTNVSPATLASYEEVIALYQIAVDHLEIYCEKDSESSIYAKEIATADDPTKALYESIFLSAYAWYKYDFGGKYNSYGTDAFGYTVFDINADETHELILMTDECDIVAIFTIFNEKATLILDNRERQWYYIDDGIVCLRYSKQNAHGYSNYFDDLYFLQDGKLTQHATELANYPSYRSRELIASYSKQSITSPFVRLSGPLTIQKPDLYNWSWSNSSIGEQFPFFLDIGAGVFTETGFAFSIMTSSYRWVVGNITALREGDVAYFDTSEISGRIEFGYQSVWLIIEKSTVAEIFCGAFLLTDIEYSKG